MLILALNLLLIGALLAAAGWRVLKLVWERSRNAGARLHLRFVTLFALVAVAPAVVVAVTFGALVTRALDNWFSQRVQAVIENSAKVDKSFVEEQQAYLYRHLLLMAGDVNDVAPALQKTPLRFSQYLQQQAAYHEFAAVYLIDRDGRLLARAEGPGAPPFVMPPPDTLKSADTALVEHAFDGQDLFRAVYRLKAFPDAYLYVARFVPPGVLNQLRRGLRSLGDRLSRGRRQPASGDPGRLRPQLWRDRPAGAGGRRLAGHGRRQQHFRAGRPAGPGGRPCGRRRPERPGGNQERP